MKCSRGKGCDRGMHAACDDALQQSKHAGSATLAKFGQFLAEFIEQTWSKRRAAAS